MGIVSTQVRRDEPEYDTFLAALQRRFDCMAPREEPVFVTQAVADGSSLFDVYLHAIPARDRQYYNCSACRRFVNQFGSLVTIDVNGQQWSVFWDEREAPSYLFPAILALRSAVENGLVLGPFYTSEGVWGYPVTRHPVEWHHMGVKSSGRIFVAKTKRHGAKQEMAERLEEFRLTGENVHEYEHVLPLAMAILKSGAIERVEKVWARAKWAQDLMVAMGTGKNSRARRNLMWRAVALAPQGFAHLGSSVLGSLLDDLKAGANPEVAARAFNAKMNPILYQRPPAPPTAGNIARAEEIVKDLGLAPSLERRFARREELRGVIWREPSDAPTGGIFDHLRPGAGPSPDAVVRAVRSGFAWTWVKFARDVLPEAAQIHLIVPSVPSAFFAILTATHPEAPPILQWDSPEQRNPFSWYVWHGGSLAQQWGLTPGSQWHVPLIVKSPAHWDTPEKFRHHAESALLILEGAQETKTAGLALFPECLKGELREVRATVEAHSKTGRLTGQADASACGLMISAGAQSERVKLVVRRRGLSLVEAYVIDRWE
jgi:hypothetical protein